MSRQHLNTAQNAPDGSSAQIVVAPPIWQHNVEPAERRLIGVAERCGQCRITRVQCSRNAVPDSGRFASGVGAPLS